ncbi:hypothetical protein M1271_01430 [Patescibacteria group bacterium]|nr:hypothetical protein [Patescibacteria group bacterium]MCL5798106.1 hypothetical protein [Patescibacteria group bacterium]
MKNIKSSNSQGQALVTLLFFVIVAITVTSAATVIILVNSLSTEKTQQSTINSVAAESGIENAILQLLRDPTYTGSTMSVGDNSVQTTVSGSNIYTITATASAGNIRRAAQAQVQNSNNVLSVLSWKEIY